MPNKKTRVEVQSLVETHHRPFMVMDREYRILAMNRAYERAYGAKSDRIEGQFCFQVSHTRTGPCHQFGEECPLQKAEETGEAYSCLHVHQDEHGHPHRVRVTMYPLAGEGGEIYLGEEIEELSVEGEYPEREGPMVGSCQAFLKALEHLHLAAGSQLPVLLQGETGTGKELAAGFIHRHSERAGGPFLTLDCTVLTESLFENEVFGHERGAFTGSVGEKQGLFELADGGTLFLDEIGELPASMQAKLLRVLESGEFRRVGGQRTLHADVRIVCATNRHLWEAVHEGRFREDLYYRIACITVHLPSLRERREDIPAIAESLLQRMEPARGAACHLTRAAAELLQGETFPGNIRELRNVLFAAATHSPDGRIDAPQVRKILAVSSRQARPAAAGPAMQRTQGEADTSTPPAASSLGDLEARHIAELLATHGGNRRLTAEALGISPRTLYRKLRRYGLS